MRSRLVILLLCLTWISVSAQRYPERHHLRAGNRSYGRGEWQTAEERYRRADTLGRHNLGSALYRQERFEEAAGQFDDMPYNLGNALFGQQKLQEALEAYKNAMRLDPADMDAKFNYAYVKKLLENQSGGGGGEDENNEENNEQEEQNEGQNEDQQGAQQDEQEGEQGRDGDGLQGTGGMERSDAEAMLDAIAAQERRTQEKMDETQHAIGVAKSGKNW